MKLVFKYIIITALLLISTQIKAQSFKGGFFGGLAMSQIDGDKIDGYNRRLAATHRRNPHRNHGAGWFLQPPPDYGFSAN